MSCKSIHDLYSSELLSNVTLSLHHLCPFVMEVGQGRKKARSIRSLYLHLGHFSQEMIMSMLSTFVPISSLETEDTTAKWEDGIKKVVSTLFLMTRNLQNLVVLERRFMFPFQFRHEGRTLPFNLMNSIRKLYIRFSDPEEDELQLSGANVVWLLVFCRHLREVAIKFLFRNQDFHFLSLHHEVFSELSNVERLALDVGFAPQEANQKNFWDLPKERTKVWKGESKKTEALILLLSATKNLTGLELRFRGSDPPVREEPEINPKCLSYLQSSFDTLRHLRLFMVAVGSSKVYDADPPNYSLFKQLRIITMDQMSLLESLKEDNPASFPATVDTFILPFYMFNLEQQSIETHIREELYFAWMLRKQSLPGLKEVWVPSSMINTEGEHFETSKFDEEWRRRRREFEKEEVFTGGRI